MTEVELPSTTVGIHPPEEAATYRHRAASSRFLSRWLHRLEDIEDRRNNDWRALRHPYRRTALSTSRMCPGEWDHLDDMELLDAADEAEDATRDEWYMRSLDKPPPTRLQAAAAEAGVSRTTLWRRRKRAEAAVKHPS